MAAGAVPFVWGITADPVMGIGWGLAFALLVGTVSHFDPGAEPPDLPVGAVLLRCAVAGAFVTVAALSAAALGMEPGSFARVSVVAIGLGVSVALFVWWDRERDPVASR